MPLTIVAWNCQHGSLTERLKRLGAVGADIAFVQEWLPAAQDFERANCAAFRVNPKKGIALVALNQDYTLTPVDIDRADAHSVVAARVAGPLSFNVVGIWAHPPHYSKDVLRSLAACESFIRSAPTVILGDFNSGSKLHKRRRVTKGHPSIVEALSQFSLESAYHAHHRVECGQEFHPTYRHLRRRAEPWHIDFCFLPKDWLPRVQSVEVLASRRWVLTSDHFPLVMSLAL